MHTEPTWWYAIAVVYRCELTKELTMEQHQKEKQIKLQQDIAKYLRSQGFLITSELELENNRGIYESDICATAPDGEKYHIVMLNRNQK